MKVDKKETFLIQRSRWKCTLFYFALLKEWARSR